MSPFHFFDLQGSLVIIVIILFFLISDINKTFTFKKTALSLMTFLILLANIFSLTPFIFCITRYLWGTFLMSLVIVIFVIIFKLYNNYEKYLRHLLPIRSPMLLWDFLIVLESIRNLIRPVTLSLRLSCNMLTGHVLMSLLTTINFRLFLIFIIFFEIAVGIVQSQVFSILIRTYLNE